jgi:hypothetical protein
MKYHFISIISITFLFTSTVFAEEIGSTEKKESALSKAEAFKAKADELLKKGEQQQERVIKSTDKMFSHAESSQQRGDDLITKGEEQQNKMDVQLKRYDVILDRWEQQQDEYQKYLDSLPTSSKKAKH